MPTTTTTPHRIEIVIAILNGIVGDFLHSQDDNPLAIHMQWRSLSSDKIKEDDNDVELEGRTNPDNWGFLLSITMTGQGKIQESMTLFSCDNQKEGD